MFYRMKNLSTILFFIILSFSIGCIPSNTFERNISIKNHSWKTADEKSFTFDINDTTSQYLMFAMVRHTDGYHFSNIWIDLETITPTQKVTRQKVELPLAETSGQWTGKGMDEIYEHKISLNGNSVVKFDQAGKYTIKLKQIMRENPLQEIMSIGIRLERIPVSQ